MGTTMSKVVTVLLDVTVFGAGVPNLLVGRLHPPSDETRRHFSFQLEYSKTVLRLVRSLAKHPAVRPQDVRPALRRVLLLLAHRAGNPPVPHHVARQPQGHEVRPRPQQPFYHNRRTNGLTSEQGPEAPVESRVGNIGAQHARRCGG